MSMRGRVLFVWAKDLLIMARFLKAALLVDDRGRLPMAGNVGPQSRRLLELVAGLILVSHEEGRPGALKPGFDVTGPELDPLRTQLSTARLSGERLNLIKDFQPRQGESSAR